MASVVEPIIRPDVNAIAEHLRALFDPLATEYPQGLIEISYGFPGPDHGALFGIGRIEDAVTFAVEMNNDGKNVYVGVNPRKPGTKMSKRASDSDVEIAIWQFADIDKNEAVETLKPKLALPPNLNVITGRTPNPRPHLYWLLDEPVHNLAEWSARQQGLAAKLGGDPVINPSRIMRLAGTVNYPTDKKMERGYRTELATLKVFDEDDRPPVPVGMFIGWCPPAKVQEAPPAANGTHVPPEAVYSGAIAGNGVNVASILQAIRSGDQWHNNMVRLVGHMAVMGRMDAEILGLAASITLPGFTVDQTLREMRQALDGARRKFNAPNVETVFTEGSFENGGAIIDAVDAFDFSPESLPVRPWLVRGMLLASHTHILVAPGGSGKSLFTLQFAMMMASGKPWGGFQPKHPCKTLLINAEDDLNEQRRRLHGATTVMDLKGDDLRGKMFIARNVHDMVIAKIDPRTKSVTRTPMVAALREYIKENDIKVVVVDPFAETFEGDENSNSEIKWAMLVWRDEIARETGCAVYLVHHTTKYASGKAGDADAIRGGSAIVNSVRVAHTLFSMTAEEAAALNVEPEKRYDYIRLDDAKLNLSRRAGVAKWFEKRSIDIGNGAGLEPSDEVGALVPWEPPSGVSGCTRDDISSMLSLIARGMDHDGPTVIYYAERKDAKERWIGHPIMQCLGLPETRVKGVVDHFKALGVLEPVRFIEPRQRKERDGLKVIFDKIPTAAEAEF